MVRKTKQNLSIIIPVYNAVDWIGTTLQHLHKELKKSTFQAEVIIVDDGSTDGSGERAVQEWGKKNAYPLRLITQANSGRYLARKAGVAAAKHDSILFIDSRVYARPDSLKYLANQLEENPNQLWNGHVYNQKEGNIFARFWDAIVCIAWRKYFSNPRKTSFGLDEFDYYPKGTGFFYVPKKWLLSSMKEFESQTSDLRNSSDDTLLIRDLVSKNPINLSPGFACTYNARSDIKQFLRHAFYRGQFFVDGFLRPGTRFFVPLIGVYVACLLLVVAVVASPFLGGLMLAGGAILMPIALFLGALILKINIKDSASLALLSIPFAATYLVGLWVGLYKKLSTTLSSRTALIRLSRTLVPLLVLAIGILVHFWYVLLHPSEVLYGGPGDHTAGMIWLYEQYSASPWWQSGVTSAFPFGEKYWSPVYIFGQLTYVVFWMLAKLTGSSIAGYNLLIIGSFSLCYSAAYLIIRHFCRSLGRLIPSMLAYLAAFTPYALILAAAGHQSWVIAPAYALVLMYCIIKLLLGDSVKKYVVFAGLLIGFSWLIDAYYLLFSAVLVLGLIFGSLLIYLTSSVNSDRFMVTAKRLVVVGLISLIGLLPLAIFSLVSIQEVGNSVLSIRPDITEDAMMYSAGAKDFMFPSDKNPFVLKPLVDLQDKAYSEGSRNVVLYGGLLIYLLAVISFIWVITSKQARLVLRQKPKHAALIVMLVCASSLLFLFSLKPITYLGPLVMYMPSAAVIEITSVWRVFARLFTFLYPVFIVLLAVLLAVVLKASEAKPKQRKVTYAVIVLIIGISAIDMLPRAPFDSKFFWNVEKSIPSTYQTIKQDDEINSIVDYPLREQPHYFGSMYLTAQLYHKKALVNANGSEAYGYKGKVRQGLIDLSNPQTIPALNFLGVDAMHVWGMTDTRYRSNLRYPGLENKIDETVHKNQFGKYEVSLFKIDKTSEKRRFVVIPDYGQKPLDSGRRVVKAGIPLEDEVATFRVFDMCNLVKDETACSAAKPDKFNINYVLHNDSDVLAVIYVANKASGKVDRISLQPKSSTARTAIDTKAIDIYQDKEFYAYGKVEVRDFYAK